ncbi:hypothetical protein Taro_020429, partial [Colocasia esculenta]|nr:hypothetical protein [Colocasia esculenta]
MINETNPHIHNGGERRRKGRENFSCPQLARPVGPLLTIHSKKGEIYASIFIKILTLIISYEGTPYSVKILRGGTSKVPGRRKANPKLLEMAVTYGPLVVNNHARFGYLATPIVFGDFPAVVGSPYFLG